MRAVLRSLVLVLVLAACARVPPHRVLPDLAIHDRGFRSTVVGHAQTPILEGNRVDLLLNGEAIFPAVLDAVRSARATITYAQYSAAEGPVTRDVVQALAERCRAGVSVHVLLDAFGTLWMPAFHVDHLHASGCQVVRFRPITPFRPRQAINRNHRRVLVVDGRLGFTGGSGLSRKWMGDGRVDRHWRETDVRVAGPVVAQLQAAFVEHWLEATGHMLSGDGYFPVLTPAGTIPAHVVRTTPRARHYAIYTTMMLAIAAARESILVTNPYFVPDDAMQAELVAARARGVRVALLLPGVIDHEIVRRISYTRLGPLLRAGAEVHEYTAALLHAKTMVVDGAWATVGSTNLINRSFALDDELNLVVYDPGFAGSLARVFEEDIRYARRLSYATWSRRGLRQRIVELLAVPARALGAL